MSSIRVLSARRRAIARPARPIRSIVSIDGRSAPHETCRQSSRLLRHRHRTSSPLGSRRIVYPDMPLGAPCDRDGFLHGVHRRQMLLGWPRSHQQTYLSMAQGGISSLPGHLPGIASGCETSDYLAVPDLLGMPVNRPRRLLADKGYDADSIRQELLFHGTGPISRHERAARTRRLVTTMLTRIVIVSSACLIESVPPNCHPL